MARKILILVFCCNLFLTIFSCDRPECANQNPVFDKYEMESEEYKKELWKQVNTIGQENLTYWFEKCIEGENEDFIIVHIQNNSLCAKGKILVDNWDKMKSLKAKHSNNSYRGAEMRGLKFELIETKDIVEFIFKDIKRIID